MPTSGPWPRNTGSRSPRNSTPNTSRGLLPKPATRRPYSLSIGSGNCDAEIRVARMLRESGVKHFTIECLDVNPAMLLRGHAQAEEAGFAGCFRFTEADFNRWQATRQYTAVVANQSLHHVFALETLFDEVKRSLRPGGYFVTSDMIGRNGHQRWPEALEAVQRFWRELPIEYRYNRVFDRYEEEYIDYDCSVEGFEGIRAQDILSLLLERFDFHLFVAFGNVVNVFLDRRFGVNFDAKADWDRGFIDRVHGFDEQAILSGEMTPTQMFAVMTAEPCAEHHFSRGLTPQGCVRKADSNSNMPKTGASRSQPLRYAPRPKGKRRIGSSWRPCEAGRRIAGPPKGSASRPHAVALGAAQRGTASFRCLHPDDCRVRQFLTRALGGAALHGSRPGRAHPAPA